ncbi:2-methylcitrate dehydratase [Sporosarcina sp. P13]|uniref:MmgE/PrpD family protein n=1 Tax=Sporosarcina sp. P13 TaxID=2048263 RepID=UPI000C17108C|nr:MmgE/PrpD family protein [Sporosarcina sp. P13]PIC64909.1 2-methylcitrate dehydratase [Sporosarcina sp. P13]
MSLSEKLAKYSSSLTYEDLPEEVVAFAKLCILDYFGSALAGVNKPPVQMISETVNVMGGNPQATLLTGGKSSVMNAALVNGAASHIVELDDIHKSSIIHAATVVVPAALAVAEWKELSGKDLILAVVLGYEVCFRVGEAVSPSHYYYWHNTATCGTFGSAAAVAKLLQLDDEAYVNALGNAGSQAAGLWEFIEDGAMTKQLHPGKAAMNGLLASVLAEKGFTGAKQILEGKRGFFNAMSDEYDSEKITLNLGNEHKILENSFKIHASCRHTHAAIDMAIEIFEENEFSVEDISKVEVGAYKSTMDITDNTNPKTQYESKFSIQYCTALALVKGSANLNDFNEDDLWNPEIRGVMSKVEATLDPEVDKDYPVKWGAKVSLHLKNGDVFEKQSYYPKGDPENPVTTEDLQRKFFNLAKPLSEDKRDSFSEVLLSLENINNVSEMMSDLSNSIDVLSERYVVNEGR